MRQILLTKLKSDFAKVMAANLFSYLITFCGSVIYVRMLGKLEFGIYTFAFGIVSLFLLVNGFGAASGVLQYVSRAKTDQEGQAYLRFAFNSGLTFNLIIGLGLVVYALWVPLPMAGAKSLLLGMALFPVGRLYIDIYQAYLRAIGDNHKQAQFLVINNCILLASSVVGIYWFKLNGLVYFTYLGYLIMVVLSSVYLKLPLIVPLTSNRATQHRVWRRQFISYSFFTTLANAFSGLIFVLDTIIISYLVKSPQLLASYKVATIIPFAINFIPNIVINFYYPQFAKNAHNPLAIKKLAKFIRKRMLVFSLAVSLALIGLAKPLILLIFGKNYHDSILPFQILSGGYWIIASFRSLNGNIIAALGRAKLSFYLTFIILLVNLGLTYYLVCHYAIIGAAVAVLAIYIFSSLVGHIALQLILRRLS